eukprot:gene15435-6678_t
MAWRYLQDALLLSLPNATVPECTKSCVQHPKCKSINMKSDNTGCELNSKHHDMLGISMITTAGWTYVSTDYQSLKIGLTCRSASFCPPNVLCRDTCDPPYYECVQCDAFHEGLHCDRRKDFDECLHSPCQNNGSCTDLTKDYLCNCTPGYTGKSCETEYVTPEETGTLIRFVMASDTIAFFMMGEEDVRQICLLRYVREFQECLMLGSYYTDIAGYLHQC